MPFTVRYSRSEELLGSETVHHYRGSPLPNGLLIDWPNHSQVAGN